MRLIMLRLIARIARKTGKFLAWFSYRWRPNPVYSAAVDMRLWAHRILYPHHYDGPKLIHTEAVRDFFEEEKEKGPDDS